MPRAIKKGLDYFPTDVDIWDDFKIMDLLDRYGPEGFAVYNVTVCMVYKSGYYLKATMPQLCALVTRKVGNRWINDKQEVEEILRFCGEIGLFDSELLSDGIVTSVGIQRRYAEVTARSRADKSNYWLLKDETPAQPLNSRPKSAQKPENTPASQPPVPADIAPPPTAPSDEPAAHSLTQEEAPALTLSRSTEPDEPTVSCPVTQTDVPAVEPPIPPQQDEAVKTQQFAAEMYPNAPLREETAVKTLQFAAEMTPNKRKENKRKENKKKGKESVCVWKLPCSDGELAVTRELLDAYTHTYPHMNVEDSLKKLTSYLIANPTKRAAAEGMRGYMDMWLEDDDRSGKYRKQQTISPTYDLSDYESYSVIDQFLAENST